jgi:hypothetical protein
MKLQLIRQTDSNSTSIVCPNSVAYGAHYLEGDAELSSRKQSSTAKTIFFLYHNSHVLKKILLSCHKQMTVRVLLLIKDRERWTIEESDTLE